MVVRVSPMIKSCTSEAKQQDHQSVEEKDNMHRRAAVSSKLTRCEQNNSVRRIASDREVPTVHLFVYHWHEQ
jgi:hypothetical protein